MAAKKTKKPEVERPAAAKPKAPAKKPAKAPAAKTTEVDVDAWLGAQPAETKDRLPDKPIAIVVAEALDIAHLASDVLKALAKLPDFDVGDLSHLPGLAHELSAAETAWKKARAAGFSGDRAKLVAEAEELRKDIVDSGRFLLRADLSAQKRLDFIVEGSGVPDLVEDLKSLADLLREDEAIFAADPSLERDAADRALELVEDLEHDVDPATAIIAQAKRNQLFWVVDGLTADVRAALRFLWRKDPVNLKRLGSYDARFQRVSRQRRLMPVATPK